MWSPDERIALEHRTRYAIVGPPETVKRRAAAILAETVADELILTGQIYDHGARLRSFEIAAEVLGGGNFQADC